MSLPAPWPIPTLDLFEIDFGALFASVESYVRESRSLRRQPPLTSFLIGQESLPQWTSAPSIYIVPRGMRIKSVRRNGVEDPPVNASYSQWLLLECHCWGDDDPMGQSQVYSFSTTSELARQLIMGFVDAAIGGQVARGEAHTLVESSEFRQLTNVNRQGRTLVLNLAQETFIMRDPPVIVPVATATTPGVQASVTVSMGDPPPATSEPAGPAFLVPNGPNG